MIDWKKSAKLNNCSVEQLKARFVRFPVSQKRVVGICDKCNKVRKLVFSDYRDLCHPCSQQTDEARKDNSYRTAKWHKDNPEESKKQTIPNIGRSHSIEWCAAISKGRLESTNVKVHNDKQRGGNDICDHHYIYDHSDLSLNTVQMTRSDHTSLHNVLRGLKYIVPHINKVI